MNTSPEAIQGFWNWFQNHLTDLASLPNADSAIRKETLAQLRALAPRLGLETPESRGGIQELIVTIGTHAPSKPLAEALVAAAPSLPGWKFTALKPAYGFAFTTNHQGIRFEPQAMWFLTLEDQSEAGRIAIRVGIPNFTSTSPSHARAAVGEVLATAIGERSLAEDILSFEVVQLPRSPEPAGYIELFELPEIIEERRQALA
ncbi:hypothetical protein [Luteolibacter sp. LG18]|uniref:hypothetical protein n=1 Tax=Luteolibacter sp. LG18 TaxID=2819286 RepID=UPI002B2E1FC2|nr:hypothetical protein llg_30260 [Luteolibacter sp. LG18]